MRALVFALFLFGCTEHGEGGPDGHVPDHSFPLPDAGVCAQGVSCTADQSCFIEGHADCNEPPASGGCNCIDGAFVCFTSCPAGCPEFSIPHDGDSCEGVDEGATCPYTDPSTNNRTECRCSAGIFDCTP